MEMLVILFTLWICSIFAFIVALKVYLKLTTGWCKSKVCLVGKTVIVTGSNTGIGYETALEFAKRGARVILACRNEEKARTARNTIVQQTLNENVVVKLLDLSKLSSVKRFAEDILNTEQRLDILVNNAGMAGTKDKLTEDGLQLGLQINYFAPVLLTLTLLGLLKRSAPSRIINVSSLMAKHAKMTVDDLSSYTNSYKTYGHSKVGNIIFTMELAKLLQKDNVYVFSLHPGAIQTEIFRVLRGWRKTLLDAIKGVYFKTAEEGAQTTLHAALELGIERYTGGHFSDCNLTPTYDTVKDPKLRQDVWEKTLDMLNWPRNSEVFQSQL